VIVAATLAFALAAPAPAVPEHVAGGDHWRLETDQGPVHVWKPDGYDARTAGIVFYVHGYYVTADGAFDQVATPFAHSALNALLVVPEAPSGGEDTVRWNRAEDLIQTVAAGTGLRPPPGPVIMIGHSGAFRTILPWLPSSRLDQLVLLDALYGDVAPFRDWLRAAPVRLVNRMIVVAVETAGNADLLWRAFRGARRDMIPESEAELQPKERRARLLYLKSQYTHDELVTDGRVWSLLLRLTPLQRLPGGALQ
jgi:hypothetical protein